MSLRKQHNSRFNITLRKNNCWSVGNDWRTEERIRIKQRAQSHISVNNVELHIWNKQYRDLDLYQENSTYNTRIWCSKSLPSWPTTVRAGCLWDSRKPTLHNAHTCLSPLSTGAVGLLANIYTLGLLFLATRIIQLSLHLSSITQANTVFGGSSLNVAALLFLSVSLSVSLTLSIYFSLFLSFKTTFICRSQFSIPRLIEV